MRSTATNAAFVFAAILAVVGCDTSPDLVYLPDRVQPVPITDIPVSVRQRNWSGVGRHGYGGSCVHASTKNVFRTIGRDDLDRLWARLKLSGYQGPETGNGILEKFRANQIPHLYTETGDVSLLDRASRSGRPAIIFYYPSHCITFLCFDNRDGNEVAVMLDNNFPNRYIVVDREIFERSWRHFGGFAAVPWLEPATPRTFPRTVPR